MLTLILLADFFLCYLFYGCENFFCPEVSAHEKLLAQRKTFPDDRKYPITDKYISILARKKRRLSCRQFKNLPLFLNFKTYNYVIIIFQPHHQKILHVKRYFMICFVLRIQITVILSAHQVSQEVCNIYLIHPPGGIRILRYLLVPPPGGIKR